MRAHRRDAVGDQPLGRVARLRDSWQRLLSHPRLGLGLGAAAVALSAPCLALGFFLDEYTARFIYSDLPGARQMYHSYSGGYGIATGDPGRSLQQVEQGLGTLVGEPEATHRADASDQRVDTLARHLTLA